jgi:hypothetical protein
LRSTRIFSGVYMQTAALFRSNLASGAPVIGTWGARIEIIGRKTGFVNRGESNGKIYTSSPVFGLFTRGQTYKSKAQFMGNS